MLVEWVCRGTAIDRAVTIELTAVAGALEPIVGIHPGHGTPQVRAGLLHHAHVVLGQRSGGILLLHENTHHHALVRHGGIVERSGHAILERQRGQGAGVGHTLFRQRHLERRRARALGIEITHEHANVEYANNGTDAAETRHHESGAAHGRSPPHLYCHALLLCPVRKRTCLRGAPPSLRPHDKRHQNRSTHPPRDAPHSRPRRHRPRRLQYTGVARDSETRPSPSSALHHFQPCRLAQGQRQHLIHVVHEHDAQISLYVARYVGQILAVLAWSEEGGQAGPVRRQHFLLQAPHRQHLTDRKSVV